MDSSLSSRSLDSEDVMSERAATLPAELLERIRQIGQALDGLWVDAETKICTVDEAMLESSPLFRFNFLCDFIGFTKEDFDAIRSAEPIFTKLGEHLVNAIYRRLFSYDASKKHFLQQQYGMEEDAEVALGDAETLTLTQLTLDHPHMLYRKKMLAKYLMSLVSTDFGEAFVLYLDWVGRIHTTAVGNGSLMIPLVQMNALMGLVVDTVIVVLHSLGLEHENEIKLIRAFCKLFSIQQDFISKHYQAPLLESGPGQEEDFADAEGAYVEDVSGVELDLEDHDRGEDGGDLEDYGGGSTQSDYAASDDEEDEFDD